MVRKSWNVPQLASLKPESSQAAPTCGLWGSVRLTYTICAFLSNILQMSLRNMLGLVILRMVKARPEDALIYSAAYQFTNRTAIPNCGNEVFEPTTRFDVAQQTGDLEWTRKQELTFPGTFYYGYVIALPLAGHLADRFGGKLLFISSLTLQAAAFIVLPFIAQSSYIAAVTTLVVAGMFGGCGAPPLYQLFVIWAHPTERTLMLSFAYSGMIVGSICIYPLANYLSDFGWKVPFFVLGGVTLLYGISCNWLIFNSLDEHPRLTAAERAYLQPTGFAQAPQVSHFGTPWRSLLTSAPVYAFVFTHVFHNYGFLLLSLNVPRFMSEAMQFNMKEIGFLASAPFLGSFFSKLLCVFSCSYFERRLFSQLCYLRRLLYTICCSVTITLIVVIILASCKQKILVLLMYFLVGATTDLAFSGGYWPTLLYFAPSFAGLISGLANCMAHISGFATPHLVAALVHSGIKSEWNCVLLTLIFFNALAMIVFGVFSSSKLQAWDPRSQIASQPSDVIKSNTC
ncbi:hypothetical protein KR093_002699 [Drosophila rubida]|uniref:Major facilitator superfamily (MFS) profile domain-containing protein n=1 Tax=Drosophila rubida TaxID=30044 RepID=A0AAD4JSH4_9MUSC|nr:hypothetical protein KR093_002699 [Drosophila rubida]